MTQEFYLDFVSSEKFVACCKEIVSVMCRKGDRSESTLSIRRLVHPFGVSGFESMHSNIDQNVEWLELFLHDMSEWLLKFIPVRLKTDDTLDRRYFTVAIGHAYDGDFRENTLNFESS